MFTKAELAGIIGCADKELSDLISMFDRRGINMLGTPVYWHLCSIIKKAKGLADELEKGGITKIQTSSLYGEQLNGWKTGDPETRGWDLGTIHGADQAAILLWDPEIREWGETTEYGWCPFSVDAWKDLPEVYHAD